MSLQIWNKENIGKLFMMPFTELVYMAQQVHRQYFNPNEIELCTLLNIKTGACPENCAYCPQSGHYQTGIKKEKLLDVQAVVEQATIAKNNGATRFCMGAAWRAPSAKNLPKVVEIIKAVKDLGLETCLTIGMLTAEQARALKKAQLDFYNHNLDTSESYYKNIITSHHYADRLATIKHVREAGIHVCCGGILGLGESREDRVEFILQLTKLNEAPESIPLNRLIPIHGTPLEKQIPIENVEFIRTVAVTRIVLRSSRIRLSAGRNDMSEEMQVLCFMAGANSIHYGDKLLVTKNPAQDTDLAMLKKFGFIAKSSCTSSLPC